MSNETSNAPTNELPILNRATDYRSVYANNATFESSAFDIGITFGEILGIEGDRLIVEQHVKVIMSPLHAKLLFNVFRNTLKQYEATFGEIKPPTLKAAEPEVKQDK